MDKLDYIVSVPNTQGGWTDADLAAIFGRAVVDGLIENSLTPGQAYQKARLAGSYGRRVLEQREAVTTVQNALDRQPIAEAFKAGLRAMTGTVGGRS